MLRHFMYVLAYLFLVVIFLSPDLDAQERTDAPVRQVLTFDGDEREFFVRRPHDFDAGKPYWLLVVVHGGGGNGRSFWLLDGICDAVADLRLDALIVSPSFSNVDFQASRFPALGEGAFLKAVIDALHDEFLLYKQILLVGYSRGGQFAHRFAFQNPNLVKACAAFSAGTWTTPGGRSADRINRTGRESSIISWISIKCIYGAGTLKKYV